MPTFSEIRNEKNLPVIIADNQGIVVYVNREFERVFGWSTTELVGQLITRVMPPYFRDAHHLGFSRFVATENSVILNHPLQLKALTKDNREILSEHYIAAEKEGEKWLFAATLRPLED